MQTKYLIAVCLLVLATHLPAQTAEQAPDLQAQTDGGLSIAVFSEISPLEINKIHSWRIVVSDQQDQPVNNASVTVTGGMPDHDHGLPTQPQITDQLAPGTYLLEGVRFHMPGKWQIIVSVEQDNRSSQAIIEFTL